MENNELQHYGVKGMKWGVRRTPEQLGHDRVFRKSNGGIYSSDDVVFVSGKVKFDEPIPGTVKRELDNVVAAKSKIIIGDAPGADTRVQDYLSSVGYRNVTVYTTDDRVRNNVGNWTVKKISGNGKETEREVRAQKDIAMSNAATKGIAISSDDDRADSATSLNIKRLIESNKSVQFYDFKKDVLSENEVNEVKHSMNDYLAHWGIKGMKWGVRRFQNADGTLTAAGKKRYAEEVKRLKDREQVIKNKERAKAQMAKLEAKRKELDEREKALDDPKPEKVKKIKKEEPKKKRSIKDLSNEELIALTERLKLEKNYRDVAQELTPKANKGKGFIKSFKEDVLIPGVKEGGKKVVKDITSSVASDLGKKVMSFAVEETKKKKK